MLLAPAIVLGFFLPGWLLARALGARQPWLLAFPLSVSLLYAAAVGPALLGLPLRFGVTLALLVTLSAGLAVPARRWRTAPAEGAEAPGSAVLLAGLGLAFGVMLLRLYLAPLQGYDVAFRWEFLARQMWRLESLAFYPPRSPATFHDYFYPDGFPPLVSAVYWWIYAALGAPAPRALSLVVAAQLAACFALCHGLTRALAGPRAAWLAVGALAASPLFFYAVAIGQETGLTALAVLAMFYVAVAEKGRPHAAVLCGLTAALAPLARDYGLAFLVLGIGATASARWRLADIARFAAVACVLAGPWYVRNFWLTGNPIYSNALASLPVNPMHGMIMNAYREGLNVGRWQAGDWAELARFLLASAPLPMTAGLVGAGLYLRSLWPFSLGAALVFVVYLWSVGFTAGGFLYAARLLSPALALLAVLAGVVLARRVPGTVLAQALVVTALAWSALENAAYPTTPFAQRPALRDLPRAAGEARPPYGDDAWREILEPLEPGLRVLSDSSYLHSAAVGTGIDVVPLWSPEVSFLLDRRLDGRQARARLQALGIRHIQFGAHELNASIYRWRLRLYAEDTAAWVPRVQSPDGRLVIYRLPE